MHASGAMLGRCSRVCPEVVETVELVKQPCNIHMQRTSYNLHPGAAFCFSIFPHPALTQSLARARLCAAAQMRKRPDQNENLLRHGVAIIDIREGKPPETLQTDSHRERTIQRRSSTV